MTASLDPCHARFQHVLDYIDTHLEEPLDLSQLSAAACFSRYHFQRRFSAWLGMGVHRYVRVLRLKRAAYRLAFRPHERILDIALASGYESPEAFTRGFRKLIGQTPSAFRRAPQWSGWHKLYLPLAARRNLQVKSEHRPDQVKLIHVEPTCVAVLHHRGDPAGLGESIRRFIDWRRAQHLPPRISATFNILYNDPQRVAPADFRMDLCAATDRAIESNPHGVMAGLMPGGRCAVLRHTGADHGLGAAISYLHATWLPQSGEQLRDFPLYLQRIRYYPDVPEHEAVTDIFLPLR